MKSNLKFTKLKKLIKLARDSKAGQVTVDFIDSVDDQLNTKGYLTEKQVDALDNIIANTRNITSRPSDYYVEFYELEDIYDEDFDPFDH